MNARLETRLWMAQRFSAMVLGFCVLAHLFTIIYAMDGGLSAAEILGRTQGNGPLAAFYSVFVLAVAVHAPLGLRSVFDEWLAWRGKRVDLALAAFALFLAVWGFRAVIAVFVR